MLRSDEHGQHGESMSFGQIALRALKYDWSPHLEWRAGLIHQSPSWIASLAPPGTVCAHHGRGIEFTMDHFGLSLFQPGA